MSSDNQNQEVHTLPSIEKDQITKEKAAFVGGDSEYLPDYSLAQPGQVPTRRKKGPGTPSKENASGEATEFGDDSASTPASTRGELEVIHRRRKKAGPRVSDNGVSTTPPLSVSPPSPVASATLPTLVTPLAQENNNLNTPQQIQPHSLPASVEPVDAPQNGMLGFVSLSTNLHADPTNATVSNKEPSEIDVSLTGEVMSQEHTRQLPTEQQPIDATTSADEQHEAPSQAEVADSSAAVSAPSSPTGASAKAAEVEVPSSLFSDASLPLDETVVPIHIPRQQDEHGVDERDENKSGDGGLFAAGGYRDTSNTLYVQKKNGSSTDTRNGDADPESSDADEGQNSISPTPSSSSVTYPMPSAAPPSSGPKFAPASFIPQGVSPLTSGGNENELGESTSGDGDLFTSGSGSPDSSYYVAPASTSSLDESSSDSESRNADEDESAILSTSTPPSSSVIYIAPTTSSDSWGGEAADLFGTASASSDSVPQSPSLEKTPSGASSKEEKQIEEDEVSVGGSHPNLLPPAEEGITLAPPSTHVESIPSGGQGREEEAEHASGNKDEHLGLVDSQQPEMTIHTSTEPAFSPATAPLSPTAEIEPSDGESQDEKAKQVSEDEHPDQQQLEVTIHTPNEPAFSPATAPSSPTAEIEPSDGESQDEKVEHASGNKDEHLGLVDSQQPEMTIHTSTEPAFSPATAPSSLTADREYSERKKSFTSLPAVAEGEGEEEEEKKMMAFSPTRKRGLGRKTDENEPSAASSTPAKPPMLNAEFYEGLTGEPLVPSIAPTRNSPTTSNTAFWAFMVESPTNSNGTSVGPTRKSSTELDNEYHTVMTVPLLASSGGTTRRSSAEIKSLYDEVMGDELQFDPLPPILRTNAATPTASQQNETPVRLHATQPTLPLSPSSSSHLASRSAPTSPVARPVHEPDSMSWVFDFVDNPGIFAGEADATVPAASQQDLFDPFSTQVDKDFFATPTKIPGEEKAFSDDDDSLSPYRNDRHNYVVEEPPAAQENGGGEEEEENAGDAKAKLHDVSLDSPKSTVAVAVAVAPAPATTHARAESSSPPKFQPMPGQARANLSDSDDEGFGGHHSRDSRERKSPSVRRSNNSKSPVGNRRNSILSGSDRGGNYSPVRNSPPAPRQISPVLRPASTPPTHTRRLSASAAAAATHVSDDEKNGTPPVTGPTYTSAGVPIRDGLLFPPKPVSTQAGAAAASYLVPASTTAGGPGGLDNVQPHLHQNNSSTTSFSSSSSTSLTVSSSSSGVSSAASSATSSPAPAHMPVGDEKDERRGSGSDAKRGTPASNNNDSSSSSGSQPTNAGGHADNSDSEGEGAFDPNGDPIPPDNPRSKRRDPESEAKRGARRTNTQGGYGTFEPSEPSSSSRPPSENLPPSKGIIRLLIGFSIVNVAINLLFLLMMPAWFSGTVDLDLPGPMMIIGSINMVLFPLIYSLKSIFSANDKRTKGFSVFLLLLTAATALSAYVLFINPVDLPSGVEVLTKIGAFLGPILSFGSFTALAIKVEKQAKKLRSMPPAPPRRLPGYIAPVSMGAGLVLSMAINGVFLILTAALFDPFDVPTSYMMVGGINMLLIPLAYSLKSLFSKDKSWVKGLNGLLLLLTTAVGLSAYHLFINPFDVPAIVTTLAKVGIVLGSLSCFFVGLKIIREISPPAAGPAEAPARPLSSYIAPVSAGIGLVLSMAMNGLFAATVFQLIELDGLMSQIILIGGAVNMVIFPLYFALQSRDNKIKWASLLVLVLAALTVPTLLSPDVGSILPALATKIMLAVGSGLSVLTASSHLYKSSGLDQWGWGDAIVAKLKSVGPSALLVINVIVTLAFVLLTAGSILSPFNYMEFMTSTPAMIGLISGMANMTLFSLYAFFSKNRGAAKWLTQGLTLLGVTLVALSAFALLNPTPYSDLVLLLSKIGMIVGSILPYGAKTYAIFSKGVPLYFASDLTTTESTSFFADANREKLFAKGQIEKDAHGNVKSSYLTFTGVLGQALDGQDDDPPSAFQLNTSEEKFPGRNPSLPPPSQREREDSLAKTGDFRAKLREDDEPEKTSCWECFANLFSKKKETHFVSPMTEGDAANLDQNNGEVGFY